MLAIRQPLPGPTTARRDSRDSRRHRRPPCPAIASAAICVSGRSCRRTLGTMTRRHVAARIADQQLQDRMRILLVGQQAQQNQTVVEPAVGNHPTVLVERIGLAGIAEPAQLQDSVNSLLRGECAVPARRRLENSRRESAQQTNIVGTPVRSRPFSSFSATTLGNGADTAVLPSQGTREERIVFRNILLPDQFRAAGRDDPLRFVGHEVAEHSRAP